MFDNSQQISYILVVLVTMLISIPIHEAMHGFAAKALGDTTAEEAGRLTLNPLQHIDLMLTILLPAFLLLLGIPPIFVAKPVPFDPRNVRYGEFGAALVGIAGPFTNLALAIIGAIVFHTTGQITGAWSELILPLFIQINIVLFVFNMLPLPPLDGSRLLYAFAPEPVQRVMYRLESAGFGITIVVLLLLSPIIFPIVTNISEAIYTFLLR